MNNDQNSQFENGTYEQTNTESTYSYTFSEGVTPPPKPPKKRHRGKIVFAVVAVCLCVSLFFLAGLGGMTVALLTFDIDFNTYDSTDRSDLLHSDPESLLQKVESNASIYGSAGEEAFAVSGVVRKVENAVVVINARYSSSMGYQSSGNTGSGVIISDTGYILTCNHVVENAKVIQVTLLSGSVYTASLVGADATADLAVIKITPNENEPLTYVEQGCSGDLVVGESVVAIGNPLGIGLTATTGIISATERNVVTSDGTKMTLLQTDAAVNSGNSGGGLFNLDGQLIGIVNAKYSAEGVEGLAFAIPIDSAYEVEKQLIQYGYVRGVVDHGLDLLEVTQSDLWLAARKYGISQTGLYIFSSEYCADLKALDRITAVDGKSIDSERTFKSAISEHQVGDTVNITVVRSGQTVTVPLTLQEYVPDRLKSDQK